MPIILHYSMIHIIRLMIKVKFVGNLPKSMKNTVKITPDTHVKQKDINKQINNKERVTISLESPNIAKILRREFKNSNNLKFN